MQIYLATMIMSTVGYGDRHPDTAATRALTIPLAYLGFVLWFFGLAWCPPPPPRAPPEQLAVPL